MGISLITGAASGIGKAIALERANLGDVVIAIDIDSAGLKKTARKALGEIHTFEVDVSNPEEVEDLFHHIDKFGVPLNSYIASAAVGLYVNFEKMSYEQMSKVVGVNLLGVLDPARHALRRMKKGSSIVFISSVMATHSLYESVVYSASKGALVTAARTLALEAGEKGVRVNSVSPGTIQTPMLERDFSSMNREQQSEFIEKVSQANALGRIGSPQEVAKLVSYLISDDAEYITASDFRIDGGFAAVKRF